MSDRLALGVREADVLWRIHLPGFKNGCSTSLFLADRAELAATAFAVFGAGFAEASDILQLVGQASEPSPQCAEPRVAVPVGRSTRYTQ